MTFALWISFVLASLILIATPGPSVTLLIMTSINRGKREAFLMNFGIVLGNLIAMLLSFAGLGAILRAFPVVYDIMKIVGAVYLVYLGVQAWVKTGKPVLTDKQPISKLPALQAFWVTVVNPRSFFFFVSFMPQFVNKNESFFSQISLLGTTFLGLVFVTGIIYAVVANRVSRFLNNNYQKWIYRVGAINLIVTGILVLDLWHF